jgi:glucose-1-phosphate adenylyltransferase
MSSYHEAHLDLVSEWPTFDLYNDQWPIYTSYGPLPPAKLVHGAKGEMASADEALLSAGVVVVGGRIERSVLSPGVHIDPKAVVDESVLLNGVQVGAGATIKRAILDKNVVVPPKTRIGVDHEEDAARGLTIQDGLVVVGKGETIAQLPRKR